MHKEKRTYRQGFTLIELSIVLVIIGLIVGGVLVGQDLIRAAEIRATITQLERFNTAVNTFNVKYGAVPGDMNNGVALTFGFVSRPGIAGQGDGNGLLDGENGAGDFRQCGGETGMFWSDLSYANGMNLNLVEGSFGGTGSPMSFTAAPTPNVTQYPLCMPGAKLGKANFFGVYEANGYNYYTLSGLTGNSSSSGQIYQGFFESVPAMSVLQAYTIDKKIDDGFPLTGNAQAIYVYAGVLASSPYVGSAAAYTSTTCFNSASNTYATDSKINGNGTAGLCALSFRFQ